MFRSLMTSNLISKPRFKNGTKVRVARGRNYLEWTGKTGVTYKQESRGWMYPLFLTHPFKKEGCYGCVSEEFLEKV